MSCPPHHPVLVLLGYPSLSLSLSLLPAAAASQALTASARDSRLEVQERSIHQKRERAGKEGKAGARERERK